MKDYIISVCLTAIVSAIAAFLTPTSKRGELLPYVRLVSSFVIICVIISPLPRLASCDPSGAAESFIEGLELPDESFYEENAYKSLSKLNAAYLEAAIGDAVCQKFGIDGQCLTVKAQYDITNEQTKYTRILVLLHGKAVLKDPRQIEKYVTEISSIPCDCALG